MRRFRCAAVWLSLSLAAGIPAAALAQDQRDDDPAGTAPADTAVSPAWNVETSLGFDRTIEFETDEGTWINLDVSPDGRWVVFDLLGDLYRVPIDGGDAQRLTHGPAFDQLPRFSPDGGLIAFVSDRDGADQLWTMPAPPPGLDADTAAFRKVTSVDRWFPTNPWWTPDGDYLVVKRHVVDTRSLGGGELWLFHKNGGAGAMVVERRSFTSDMNEPSVSPDGRYIYYSQTGPFDYNRDPHRGIFEVVRYDRQTGRTQPVTAEAGGAARPTPSPDGTHLAFIRRIGTATVLMVRDIETGVERALFDGLDHDQMETWTVHGAFPAFAWTPDSREVVVFYGGGLHRIDVERGTTRPIAFRAHVSIPVTETVHFEQDPGRAESFRARAIRWPSITPDGSTLVFQAVGRIWQMRLPDGRPQRVAEGQDLQYAPAISPDGRQVAFTTWSDANGGAVWKAPLRAGGASRATRLAGAMDQFANPAWSPDGSRIAAIRGSGRVARGADLSGELFLRVGVLPAAGGAIREVTTTPNRGAGRSMPRLSWTADGERLVFFENDGGNTVLTTVRLDGTDRRRLATNDVAEEMALSPDGRYVAFKELHQVYVAPLPSVGTEPVTIAASGSPTPVKKLSRWGGEWISWSPDGGSVTWSLGPEVYRQRLDEIFAPEPRTADGAGDGGSAAPGGTASGPDTNVMIPAERFEIHLAAERARPEGVVALSGARVVTMRGDEVLENGTVVVSGNRILAVGPAGEVQVPEGARRVDASGKTIIPGLIDVHAHMGYVALDINPDRPWQYYANLAYGVTTTHDPSASTQFVFSNAELVEAGEIVGPRIFSTGYILYGARNPNRAQVASLDDARAHLKRLRAQGAFSVKSYNQLRRDSRQWVIAAAREEGMHVYPEGGSFVQQNWTQMIDGHTGIEHALPIAELYRDAITLTAESGTGYTPTLVVGYGGVWGENYWYQVDDVFRNERLLRFTPRGVLDARARRRMLVPEEEFYHFELARAAKRIVDAGGQVQLGAHGQLQGLAAHWELWMFEQGGMTPLEALRSATLSGARYLGMERDLGSIEPGKLADLVILDADPLEDLRNSERVHMVMKNGFLYDEHMAEIWPRQRPRPDLRF